MTESDNPYFLPEDMLAGLWPVTESAVEFDTDRPRPDKVDPIALANYRASVAAFPGPFGYGPGECANFSELIFQEKLLNQIRKCSFRQAWLATGGDWSFRRQNLVAYNTFERNWNAAGKVV